ncbi:MAG: hypothetical protein NUV83_00100 [Candidatus Wolfebacteria bacterium]|nr:hypothetical protein [Candidatus Wolfebacteria bacterium]
MEGLSAIKGALDRMSTSPANDLPVEVHQAQTNDWKNWPDWENETDFPNWENIGGTPPR